MQYGWLVLLIPAAGLFFGFIGLLGGQPEFAAFGWAVVKWSVIGGISWKLIQVAFEMAFPKHLPTQYRHYLNPHLQDGWIEDTGKTKVLHADGYAFEMANIRGRLHWREVDPITKEPYHGWNVDSPGHMAELVKSIVNLREGRV